MKNSFFKWLLCIFVLVAVAFVSSAEAASPEKQRNELRGKTEATLKQLYQKEPSAQAVIENAAGYAVFNNTGIKIGILGSAHGRGMAINNNTGREVFMKMQEFQAGFGLGVKEYALIFVFGSEEKWASFVDSGWKFGGQATTAVTDGVNGDAIEGTVLVSPGIWLYQMTTKGLAAELAIKGTEFYKDKALN